MDYEIARQFTSLSSAILLLFLLTSKQQESDAWTSGFMDMTPEYAVDFCGTWITRYIYILTAGFANTVACYISLYHADILTHWHLERADLSTSTNSSSPPYRASLLDSLHCFPSDGRMWQPHPFFMIVLITLLHVHIIATSDWNRYTVLQLLTMLALVRYSYFISVK